MPRFGSYRLGRLPAEEVENWLNDELDGGLAPSSVHRHYRTLRRVLQVAVEKKKLPANPCDAVQPPRVPKREMAFLSWGEAVDLAEAHRERYRPLIYLAVDAGPRWSELVGLRRAKLDLRRGKVRVTEQLVRLETGEWRRTGPKTGASVRSITLSSVTVELLSEHLERFAGPGSDGLVFPNGAGNPLVSASFWGNHFTPAQLSSGVRCRFHDLRHTSVALAIAQGAHPKAIQARMGHSSINVTLDRYGHLFPELDEAIAAGFGEQLAAALEQRRRTVVHATFGSSWATSRCASPRPCSLGRRGCGPDGSTRLQGRSRRSRRDGRRRHRSQGVLPRSGSPMRSPGCAQVVITTAAAMPAPSLPCRRYLDRELADPAGRPVDDVGPIRDEIDRRSTRHRAHG